MSAKTMEINDDFEIMFLSPFHGFLEVWQLTTNVRLSRGGFERPISYGESYVVESIHIIRLGPMRKQRNRNVPSSGNVSEVSLGNPSVPMVLESLCSFLPILALAERPFVNKGGISRRFK